MGASTGVVFLGIVLAWWLYGGKSPKPEQPDVLERAAPLPWTWLRNRLYIDEIYGATFIAFYAWWARVADWLDRRVWGGTVSGVALLFRGWAQLNKLLDTNVVDGTFDKGCEELSTGGGLLSRIQNGQVQAYLRWLALAVVVLVAILIWSSRA
jgi:NADH-quinone oxidoreductase subunit L